MNNFISIFFKNKINIYIIVLFIIYYIYNNNSIVYYPQVIYNSNGYKISLFIIFDIQGRECLDSIFLLKNNNISLTSPDLNKVIFVKYKKSKNILIDSKKNLEFNYNAGPHEFKEFDTYYCCLNNSSQFIKLDYNLNIIKNYIPNEPFNIHSFSTFDNNIFWISGQNSDIWSLDTLNNTWIKRTDNFSSNYVNKSEDYLFSVNKNSNNIIIINKENTFKILQIVENNPIYQFISSFYYNNYLIITSTEYQQIYLYNIISYEFSVINLPLDNQYRFLQSYYFNNNLYLISSSILDGIDAIVILEKFNINNGRYIKLIIIPVIPKSSLHRIYLINNKDLAISATGSSSLYILNL